MRAQCQLCKHDEASIRYDFGEEKILHCDHCGLLYLHPYPDPEHTASVYGDSYFQNPNFLEGDNQTLFGYADYVAERFNKQAQYVDIAREIRSQLPATKQRPRLLEVGCGFGYFLDVAFEEEFEPEGIEFNQAAVDRLTRKYRFPIHAGALETLELPQEGFDAVVLFDVIEHLRDPFSSIDKIHDALAPGGVVVISTVDAESFTSRLIGKRLEDFRRTREHLFFFSRKTLAQMLDERGFDLLDVRSIGHTFELAFLLERLALYNRPLFSALRRVVERLGLGSIQLSVNPGTKMIAQARRRATRRPIRELAANAAAAEGVDDRDRTLLDELYTLEATNRRHYKWVFDTIAPQLGRSVLEVGSGIGVISKFLVPRCDRIVLSDYREVYLDALRARFGELPHVDYRLLDLTAPPFDLGGAEVDSALVINVLEHIEDEDAALRGLAECLPRGGRLILQVPQHPRLFGSLDRAYGHHRRYTRRSLREVLDRNGFDVTSLRTFNPYSIPGWILSGRVLKRDRLDMKVLRAYDAMVPVLRRIPLVSRLAGLSLIAWAEKR